MSPLPHLAPDQLFWIYRNAANFSLPGYRETAVKRRSKVAPDLTTHYAINTYVSYVCM
jgi:hypothetical protein